MKKIVILLSTYNGERYLEEQIESLLAQKGVDIKVFVRDDGSSDLTVPLLHEYALKDSRINYYLGKNIGPGKSFFDLMKKVEDSDYYAFCDQDDVWDDDKLFVAIKLLEKYKQDEPLLYHSNLRIVDSDLHFQRVAYKKVRDEKKKYIAYTHNYMTGCTAVFNNATRKMIVEHLPETDFLHDGWMYMTCKIFGKVFYDNTPHLSYRQHEKNVIGMKKKDFTVIRKRLTRLFASEEQPRLRRCEYFESAYHHMIKGEDKEKLDKVIHYKKSLKNKINLLLDFQIKEEGLINDFRYRVLIILGKI